MKKLAILTFILACLGIFNTDQLVAQTKKVRAQITFLDGDEKRTDTPS